MIVDQEVPDHTAVRVALWRALHAQLDSEPALVDEIGLAIADPEPRWRERGDMDVVGTRRFRAGVVARARVVDDLVAEQAGRGVDQVVILGAGLDTLALRRPDLPVRVFEVDQPGTQAWKRRRLETLDVDVPDRLRFVPVDLEAGESWWDRLADHGFDATRAAVVASTGVSMYLTAEANEATLRSLATLPAGSTVVMTFQTPIDGLDAEDRAAREMVVRNAAAAGTPWRTFYAPDEIVALARSVGFADAHHVSAAELNRRYFAGRADGLHTSNAEEVLVAFT